MAGLNCVKIHGFGHRVVVRAVIKRWINVWGGFGGSVVEPGQSKGECIPHVGLEYLS